MNSKYVFPNDFMSMEDTNRVSQLDTGIKKYAEYLEIKQKYFDAYLDSLSKEK